jgi:hypothetical protein
MATTIEQIRFIAERDGLTLENDWVKNKCNEAQADFGVNINIPATTTIIITTTDIVYPLPATLKIINRLWLTSDRTNDVDKEFTWPYRIYNGSIIFAQPWRQADTLNVDYFKNMTYYASETETVDLPDRFVPLYTSFIKMEYYDLPTVKEAMGDEQARREWQKHNSRYLGMQKQVITTYSLQSEPTVVQERW